MIEGLPEWSKSQWRQAAKAVRGEAHSVYANTTKMAHLFLQALNPEPQKIIAAYWPLGDELDVRPMLQELSEKKYKIALPRIAKDKRNLDFYLWNWGDPLEKGIFGLMEPKAERVKQCQPHIFLVPLLAFDRSGTRLGHGLGHFDQALVAREGTFKIGLGYDEQEANMPLPCEPHDVRLDAVLTPKYFLRIT